MSESMSSAQLLNLRQFSLQPGTTLIEASAGTGKTFTIQYCVLDHNFRGLELKEILVLTFTESATQELRARADSFVASLSRSTAGASAKKTIAQRARVRVLNDALPI